LKKKPGGAETQTLMDTDLFFQHIRSSDYSSYIQTEVLWAPGDSDNPENLDTGVIDAYKVQVKAFLDKVKASMEDSKTMEPIVWEGGIVNNNNSNSGSNSGNNSVAAVVSQPVANSSENPKTGDNYPVIPIFSTGVVSLVAGILSIRKRRAYRVK